MVGVGGDGSRQMVGAGGYGSRQMVGVRGEGSRQRVRVGGDRRCVRGGAGYYACERTFELVAIERGLREAVVRLRCRRERGSVKL